MRKKVAFLPALILVTLITVFLPGGASAASVPNNVKYKAAYEGVYQCLSNGAYQEIFMASKGGAGMLKSALGGEMVKLPYGLTDASDNNTNCKEILKGFNDDARSDDNLRAGLLKAGIWSEKDQTIIKNYFAGSDGKGGAGSMGYEAIRAGNVENEQTTSKLTIAFNTEKLNSETCRKKSGSTDIIGTQSFYDDQGKAYSQLVFPTITKDNTGNWFLGDVASNSSGVNVPKPGSGDISFYYFCNDDSWIQIADAGSANSPYYNINVIFTSYYMDAYGTLVDSSAGLQSELVTASGKGGWDYTANTGLFKGTVTEGKVEDAGDFEDYELRYLSSGTLDQAKATMMRTLSKLSATNAAGYNFSLGASSSYDALKLTDGEIYGLYTYYVKDVFKYPVFCEGDADFSAYNDTNSREINWASGKTCRIDTAASTTPPSYNVYGINNSTRHFTEKITIDDVIEALKGVKIPDQGGETGGTVPGGTTGNTGDTNEDGGSDGTTVSNCIDAAGPLGWIICPVLKLAGETAGKLYGFIADNFLEVGSKIMGTGTSTHQAWGEFRNYANVIFIIVFLIVILSQITGFGISNYGIKKMLPRLIAVALLTNLSFIICQLAVDVSNIVGAGIKDALVGFKVTGIADAKYGVNNLISDIFGILFASAGTVGIGYLAVTTWQIWLLPLFLAIITAIVGVFMFFLSLAVRQAGIIILVVLCPVAIICYALPNTKKLFDKWFKMFTSLLMVYPICGLLMGGGQFASRVLVSLSNAEDTSFMLTLTAMLLSVVPFFFIPTIVRTALNSIGQLGARLSNFGRSFSNRMTGMVRDSERFKDAQRELATRHDEATVRRLDHRAERRMAKGKDGYTTSGRRRRLRAYMRADKSRREDLMGELYEGRGLLADDLGQQARLRENFAAKDLEEGVAGEKALYRTDPRMAKEENITAEHDEILQQFGDSPDDGNLYKKLFALEQMDMEKGAPGFDLMWQSISRWIANNNANKSWNDNKKKALSKLSAGLATRYGKELNNFDKAANTALNHFAEGNFKNLSSFRMATDKNGDQFYRSNYDTKLSSYSAAGLLEASPGALQRGMEAVRANDFVNNAIDENGVIDSDKAVQLKADERTLLGNITKAFNNDLIADKFKPTEKGYLQDAMGYGAANADYELSQYEDGSPERKTYDIFTNMEQGTIDNISQFINNADANKDAAALWQLGANIQDSAHNGRVYSESDTKRIRTMLGILNTKLGGALFKFNPDSVRVDNGKKSRRGNQGNQQDIPDAWKVSDAERAQLEADAKRNGNRTK